MDGTVGDDRQLLDVHLPHLLEDVPSVIRQELCHMQARFFVCNSIDFFLLKPLEVDYLLDPNSTFRRISRRFNK